MRGTCPRTARSPAEAPASATPFRIRTVAAVDGGNPNVQINRYVLPSEGRRIRLRVSAKGIKVIDRDGIEAVVARLGRNGEKI